jgi:hypothetical protein
MILTTPPLPTRRVDLHRDDRHRRAVAAILARGHAIAAANGWPLYPGQQR